ncbi:MAG: molybdenum cofactor cytidylyltransferase [Proteobacteria bacterium]|nr:molybdenum cofactor cytidylyltransferase [Pseudomonadota bacterium]
MISGIILASGFSKRMEQEKLLLPVNGIALVERVIRAARASRLDEVILIYQKEEIEKIGRKYGITSVYNGRAEEGQSAAIKLGINSAHPKTDAFMFMVGDQPFLNPATIDILIDTFQQDPHSIIVPVYNNTRGNPALFPSSMKELLLALDGDRGGRVLIEKMPDRVNLVSIDEKMSGADIDTEEDYRRIKGNN